MQQREQFLGLGRSIIQKGFPKENKPISEKTLLEAAKRRERKSGSNTEILQKPLRFKKRFETTQWSATNLKEIMCK